MSFEKLLEDLESLGEGETLQKSQSGADDGEKKADDDKIQAAADDGNADVDGDGKADVDEQSAAEEADSDADADTDEEGEAMGKSFTVTLEDGTEVEGFDGTELVKSLTARLEKNEGQTLKALEGAVTLIKSQGEMIKSLQDQVSKLAASGRGRKAVVSLTDKKATADLNKSEADGDQGMSAQEFMAKALSAQKVGRITGHDIARLESYINRGVTLPQDIVTRVLQ